MAYAIDSKSQTLTVNYTLAPSVNATMRPVNGVPAKGSSLVINWTSPLGVGPKTIQLSITFHYKGAQFTIPAVKPIVKGGGGNYTLQPADLNAIAHNLIDEIGKVDPSITLASPIAPITVDSVNITPDDADIDAQSVKATGTLTITPQIVNNALPLPLKAAGAAGAALLAPASDPATQRTSYIPPPRIPTGPRPADIPTLPPLPQTTPIRDQQTTHLPAAYPSPKAPGARSGTW